MATPEICQNLIRGGENDIPPAVCRLTGKSINFDKGTPVPTEICDLMRERFMDRNCGVVSKEVQNPAVRPPRQTILEDHPSKHYDIKP